ncbi:MAG: VCBS repeat-containing protein [Lewinellaceae bacterium]|nr:VCBS repeat-containing protein [Lewinellaceae bacterium]
MMQKISVPFILFCTVLLLAHCRPSPGSSGNTPPGGEALARIHCAACHQYPDPELLPRATWADTCCPAWATCWAFIRTGTPALTIIESGLAGRAYHPGARIFPESPLSTLPPGKNPGLLPYQAPDTLPLPKTNRIKEELSLFQAEFPDYHLSPPSVTLAHCTENGLYIGDANSRGLYRFDGQLTLQQAAKVREGAVGLDETEQNLRVTVMGSFSPTDAPSGFILQLPKAGGRAPSFLLQNLQRPVHSAFADLNGDGREDIVVCEFAKWTGCLAWWEQLENGSYEKHLLRNKPGAIKTEVQDFNRDGRPDILALFGQGDEGFYLYYNEGQGQFREAPALRFPPSYGSSSFRLFDYNDDGHPDILYTAGDNADYPPVLKPYHGVRIFENDGSMQFEEKFFYPIPGTYGAVARDFNQDGTLDIAAISFFPNFEKQPNESFLFLENDGLGNFRPHTFPQAGLGRWIVMDAGDIDRDGDEDIVLGSLAFEVIPDGGEVEKWVKNGIPFVVLRNQLK